MLINLSWLVQGIKKPFLLAQHTEFSVMLLELINNNMLHM